MAALRPGDDDDDTANDPAADGVSRDWAGLVAQRQREGLAAMIAGAARIIATGGAQAYCLDCVMAGGGRVPPFQQTGVLPKRYLALLAGAL